MRRAALPLMAGLLGLAGTLGTTLYLHSAAAAALERTLEERLRGAGETAAALLSPASASPEVLRSLMRSSKLEGAYLLGPDRVVLADATGPMGGPADLLRTDLARTARAQAGEPSVAIGFTVGDQPIATGYFPVRDRSDRVVAVLALEAGQEFAASRQALHQALVGGVLLSALAALALAAAAWQWARTEALRRVEAERGARGDALARMAAMVAHEVRNPLGIIRGAAELIGARAGERLEAVDLEALQDVLGEVQRLNRLTEDFLDLAREPRLERLTVELGTLVAEAARGLGHAWASVEVMVDVPPLQVVADPGRLRQVLGNLLTNACQAGATRIEVRGRVDGHQARLEVRDDGPGIPGELCARLFDPFATGRVDGTGLGLAISRRIVERLGGALELADPGPPGAVFALRLPLEPEGERT